MRKGLSGKTWLLLLGGLMALCALAAAVIFTTTARGTTAVITLDGAEVARIDLSQVTRGEEHTFTGAGGITNVVEAEPGRIRVREADCPDQVCVHQGWISTGVAPIVCLPNRLVIQIEGAAGEADVLTK